MSQRIITTTSPLVAAQYLQEGNQVVIRDLVTGRLSPWDVARAVNFGVNGETPVTFDWRNNLVTTRTTVPLTHAFVLAWKDSEYQPRFIEGTRVTFDWTRRLKCIPFEWMYLKINVHNEMVFEVFSSPPDGNAQGGD